VAEINDLCMVVIASRRFGGVAIQARGDMRDAWIASLRSQ
jgi:hypothetical protein